MTHLHRSVFGINSTGFAQPFRDQYTPAEEARQEAREAERERQMDRQTCEDFSGHDWAPAGGGLLICMNCEAEQWEDEL